MKNILIYFSSTGNSLFIAKWLSEKLPNSSYVPINKIPISAKIGDENTNIGFIFPTYFFSVLGFYTEMLRSFQLDSRSYFYGITICNGYPGDTAFQLKQTLAEMNCDLARFFVITMPGNYIVEYDAPKEAIINSRISKAKIEVDRINKHVIKQEKQVIKPRLRLTSIAFRKVMCKNQNRWHKEFHNIEMITPKPYWGEYCQHCVACIQLCPHQAIEYGNRTQKRKRYRNPHVKPNEFVLWENGETLQIKMT